SSKIWPPAKRLVSIRSMAASWPTMALRTSALICSVKLRVSSRFTQNRLSPLPDLLRRCGRVAAGRGGGLRRGVADHFFDVTFVEIARASGLDQEPRAGIDQAAFARRQRRL